MKADDFHIEMISSLPAWVRSLPNPTHKTCLLSAVGDLKGSLVPFIVRSRFNLFFIVMILLSAFSPNNLICFKEYDVPLSLAPRYNQEYTELSSYFPSTWMSKINLKIVHFEY
jgi:hypothetical protein